jgi:hypothetical protein
MKYIITENQRDRLFVLRRLDELENLIPNLYPYYYPCDYDSLGQYLLAMKIEMFEITVLDWFENVDKDVIWDVVTDVFRDFIVENYTSNCKSKIH